MGGSSKFESVFGFIIGEAAAPEPLYLYSRNYVLANPLGLSAIVDDKHTEFDSGTAPGMQERGSGIWPAPSTFSTPVTGSPSGKCRCLLARHHTFTQTHNFASLTVRPWRTVYYYRAELWSYPPDSGPHSRIRPNVKEIISICNF